MREHRKHYIYTIIDYHTFVCFVAVARPQADEKPLLVGIRVYSH